MKRDSGNVENPVAIFFVALFCLIVGGFTTWYLLDYTATGDSPTSPSSPAETTGSAGEDVAPIRTVSGEDRDYQQAGYSEESIETSRRNAIVVAAEEVGPAVVSINVLQTQVVRSRNPFFFDDFWNDFFYPRSYKREVQSLGSGFIISDEGHILTNEHVVRGAEVITVILEDGRELEATVLGLDRKTDLAILKVEAENLPTTLLGSSRNLLIGEWAIAIGNPFGYLLDDTQPTVTVGVISAVERDIKIARGEESIFADMIQTDASINPGNSGGPLVNSRGEVIGVNTFIFTKSGGSLGMGFAIPIDRAKRVYREILQYHKVRIPWIGIHPQDLTPSLRKGLNIDENGWGGVIVADVENGSPAHGAGIVRGDVIMAINDEPIRSAQDWEGILLDVQVDNKILLDVFREGRHRDVELLTVPLPTDTAEKIEVDYGIVLADVTDAIKNQLGLRSSAGALIVEIDNSQLLHDSGLEPNDVILKVNEKEIGSAREAKDALENLSRRRNSIVLERNGRMIYRSLLIG